MTMPTSKLLDQCPLCPVAQRDCAVTSQPRRCPSCAALWLPEFAEETQRDIQHRRSRPLDAQGDCDNLARWLPVITGGAMSPEPVIGGGANKTNGRRDSTDEHHSGLRRACVTLSRLDALERAGYRAHVNVLWFAFVVLGPEISAQHTVKGKKRGGRPERVAERFASSEQRQAWHEHKSFVVRREQPALWGQQLMQSAIDAYVAFAASNRSGSSVARASTQIERLLSESSKAIPVEFSAKSAKSATKHVDR